VVEPRLAVVIPAYREEASIGSVVAAAIRYGDVLVIDDCSPDATGERAAEAGATVIRNQPNRGYDGSLTRGLQEAAARRFTHVVTMDADGEHDPDTLALFRAKLFDENYPLVLGYRPHKQRFAEVVMGWYLRARFGVRDILCGMKGYRLSDWRADGLDFHDSIGTELATQALRRKSQFAQIPVSGTPRADAPRFDRLLRANIRILAAFWRCLMQDLRKGLWRQSQS
jgi:glycosyltransferase involved in cell wall biosynthesis